MEGDLTWGGEHTIQYICAPETDIILLTNVTPINSIKYKVKKGSCQELMVKTERLPMIVVWQRDHAANNDKYG